MNINSKSKYFPPLILLILAGILIILTFCQTGIFGSTCDWFTQHITLADTIRQTIYEQKTLFPSQLPIGGGTNIYNFAYYGYLRPDILIGCALPFLSMQTVITAYMIIGYLVSVLLFYRLMRALKIRIPYCFFGGIIFLCAGCFFHLHRQIIFINYMPFLLGALLSCIRYHRTGRRALLIAMLFLIELHSFYFSISCILSVYVFLIYTSGKGHDFHKLFRLTRDYCLVVLCSIFMAGILLLPAAAAIINCASGKDAGTGSVNPFHIQSDFTSLLYNPYGLGLTLVCLLLLILSLFIRRYRLLGGFLLFSCLFGIVPYILNGFLYTRAKILIPLLPLVIILIMQVLQFFWHQRRFPSVLALLSVFIVAGFQYNQEGVKWIFLDVAVVLFLYLALVIRSRRIVFGFTPVMIVCSSIIFCFSAVLHCQDELISESDVEKTEFTEDTLNSFYADSSYRFDSFLSPFQTCNNLMLPSAGRSTMYTSTTNQLYNSFYFDIIRNPIRINNRQALLSEANPFFLYLMGVRYLETTEDKLPLGYQIQQQGDHTVLAENENALPICYGSTTLISEAFFDQLSFPDTLEALTAASIVPDSGSHIFTSHFKELYPKEGADYDIEQHSETEYTIIPSEPIEDQILVLTFDVERIGSNAVTIDINNIRNKLAGSGAPYPNHNNTFTYILSSAEAMDKFEVKTNGRFEISNLHLYTLDSAYFGLDTIYSFESEETEKSEVLNGNLTLPEDGYLITSYPMQEGYTAIVDGSHVDVETVNKAFVGIPLKAGTHSIRILYRPPLRTVGALFSLLGLGTYLIIILYERKRSISS
ncbi:MAG: YfhO family protein [Lachnospiraceae bacterium]